MKVFLIEAIIGIVLFTIGVIPSFFQNPLKSVYDYPPKIIERCYHLGLIQNTKMTKDKYTMLRKIIFCIIVVIILGIILYYFNKPQNFLMAFIICYALWSIVDWWDALFVDCILFCHSKRIIIPGTEDMVDEYHNYKFHILETCKGMLIGLPVCILAAFVCQIMIWIIK